MSSTETVTQTSITADNVADLFPDVDTSLARSVFPVNGHPASDRAGSELDGYDEEQVRLMDEVCIVLDENDKPIGSASKKTCKYRRSGCLFCSIVDESASLCGRPLDWQYRSRTSSSCLFRFPVRLQQSSPPPATGVGENHLSGYVDQHMLLAPVGHSWRDGCRAGRRHLGRETGRATEVRSRAGDQTGTGPAGQV